MEAVEKTEEQIKEEQERLKGKARALELMIARRAKECRLSLYEFFLEFWDVVNPKDDFVDNWHIMYLCLRVQRIIERAQKGLPKLPDTIINIPPGMSKSTIMQMARAWTWIETPHFVIFTSTHSNDLSIDQSLKTKDIVKSRRWQQYFQPYIKKNHGRTMQFTKDNEKDWRNNLGGVQYYTSVTGSIIGKHAHIIFWDDLIDVEKADSEAVRKKANRHATTVLPSRKKDREVVPTIGIMQRLHENDPTGHILEKAKGRGLDVDLIKLPAKASGGVQPDSLREFYVNGLLDPKRLTEAVLKHQEGFLGSYKYSGQYDQEPTPEGGGNIKKAWFQYCTENEVPRGLIWELFIDGAYTDKTKNDPTGLLVCALDARNNRLYIRHAHYDFLRLPGLLNMLPNYVELNGLNAKSRIYIEPKASGHSLQQMLIETTSLSAVLIQNELVAQGKEARASTASPSIEAGRVTLIGNSDTPWCDTFVSQLAGFPNMKHDEFVDLIGYAVYHYFGGKKRRKPKRTN